MKDQFLQAPQPTLKRIADLSGPDFYPTPSWATQVFLDCEKFDGKIWEPACGDGAMAEVIKSNGYSVSASDLYDRGYGEMGVDFLTSGRLAENIVTNPPFHSAEAFVHSAFRQASNKIGMLLRLAFLESAGRQRSIFATIPPTRVWVFSERITFYPKNAIRRGSGTTAYAWFVWDKKQVGSTELKWLPIGYKSGKKS